jgi:lipopolysaccharide export system protein LptA
MYNSFFLVFCLLSSVCYGQVLDHLEQGQDNSPVIIDAEQSVVCDETAHKCVATGLAKAQKGTSTVYGDVLTVYFTDDRDITAMTADGHVRMETPTETAYGDHAHYDVALDRVLLTGGNLKIVTQKEVLTAEDSLEYWHTKNQGIARGNAVVQFPEKKQLIQANTLIAYFVPPGKEAKGDDKKTELDRVEATGNVLASGPNGVVTGDKGTYFGKTELVEIFDNVKITQGENIITGGYGRANLKTNLAELFPCAPNTKPTGPIKRISGVIIPKDIKERKKKVGEL